MRSHDILIVDDEIGIRDLLSEILQDEGYSICVAENAQVARNFRNKVRPALVLLDIWMPDCDGLTLLKEWSKNGLLDMPVIMMSGHASIDTAIEATKIGAIDFLEKPISLNKLLDSVRKGIHHNELMLSSSVTTSKLGVSDTIVQFNKRLRDIQKANGNILLIGELGSPFAMVANFFHQSNDVWVDVRLEDLLNSKFVFNLEKNYQKGILYLGDISYFSRDSQRNVLSIIKKNEDFKLRIISISNSSLENLYTNSNFDTNFINEISNNIVYIPPIRKHISEDICHIINSILEELVETKRIKMIRFSKDSLNVLSKYSWPGNYEQLKNVIKNLSLQTDGGVIDESQVIEILNQNQANGESHKQRDINFNLPLKQVRESIEKKYLKYHIDKENFNMSKVAKVVGLERTHLYRKLKQLGIDFASRKNN